MKFKVNVYIDSCDTDRQNCTENWETNITIQTLTDPLSCTAAWTHQDSVRADLFRQYNFIVCDMLHTKLFGVNQSNILLRIVAHDMKSVLGSWGTPQGRMRQS